MTSWIAASATAVALGAVGAGTFVSEQSQKWDSDSPKIGQVARVLGGGGSQRPCRDNSSASKAGAKAGDVITSLNGATVTSAADFRRRAQRLASGDEFTLGIVRDRKPMTLKGTVDARQPTRSPVRVVV